MCEDLHAMVGVLAMVVFVLGLMVVYRGLG